MVDARGVLERLGREVRRLRAERGFSRRELAVRTGISERFLADVESGRANPSVARLCELAAALATSPAALLGDPGPSPAHLPVLALLGLRGAGKSTVGAALAARLDCRFVELDAEIEARTGLSLGQIFELNGEEHFRRAEHEALRAVLDDPVRPLVIATGGGIVTTPASFELLQSACFTVWLRAAPEDHWQRVVAQGDTRPMAGRDGAFDALRTILADRERHYRAARLTVDTHGRAVDAIVAELAEAWRPEVG